MPRSFPKLARAFTFARHAMIRAGRNAPWPDVMACPGRLVRPWRSGRYCAANVMTFFQELMLSIAIAMCFVGLGNLIWSALAAVW